MEVLIGIIINFHCYLQIANTEKRINDTVTEPIMKRMLLPLLTALCLLPNADAATIILTSDQQLRDLMDPDKKIDMSTGYTPVHLSLREVCEQGKKDGDKTLTIAFDEFFRQYRPQAGTDRELTPDMDEYILKIKFISDFAKKYGMGICLSLNTPLELGPAFKRQTGQSGRWVSYKAGLRNASDGTFSIPVWEQMFWTNNKGKFHVSLKGVKAYAFKQKTLGASHLIAVNPDDIHEISGVKYEAGDTVDVLSASSSFGIKNSPDDMYFPVRELRVFYDGPKQLEGYDRVLVILEYESPEMDYFSPDATPFLHNLMDKYKKAGVNLTALYSDEMHIQQDWAYYSHHEGGQFAMRFLTGSFCDRFREKYGQPLDDKHMLYFVYGAPYYLASADAVENVQYVMGETPEEIHKTFLLRDRYYKMLNHGIVDLFKDSKEYAEKIFNREFNTSAHASWAESPTIDLWNTEKLHANAYRYEYTSNFIWSNTVHQAAAACYDYFKWGEYLQPTGNDFAECGWADRDYYGAAMGASIGVINKYPNAYAAAWGFPNAALHWKNMLNEAYGAQPGHAMSLITGCKHRDTDVLAIYPMNLVAVEERFGSWMTQYGYCNYLTSDKLVEMGAVTDQGKMKVAAKEYGTVMVMFEPLPQKGLLNLLERFAEAGGKVIWFSMPPLIDGSGKECAAAWQKIFGAEYEFDQFLGEIASGKKVAFEGRFSDVPEQTILTDMLVDRIYPVSVVEGSETVARVDGMPVGTHRKIGKGDVFFFGFRPRDDQSKSLGYETRTLFEILNAAGAYPSSGKFAVNDNPSYVSRTTDYLATSFPNGATALVKHYRTHRENWEGGFSRNEEHDAEALELNPMPSARMELRDLKVNGHDVTYSGTMNMAFRTSDSGRLMAFNGCECTRVSIDGKEYVFSDAPVNLAFSPVEDDLTHFQVYAESAYSQQKIRIPLPEGALRAIVRDGQQKISSELSDGNLLIDMTSASSSRWLDVTIKYR